MNILKFIIGLIKFNLKKILMKEGYAYDEKVQETVYEIRKNGFVIVPNFYTEEECVIFRDEIDNLIEKRKEEGALWEDGYGADKRCFVAEEDSQLIHKFFSNKYLESVVDNYFKAKLICSNTLAARIQYKEGNIGSGQGWHRDGNYMQIKALVYLSDVELKDGPFQIMQCSHKIENIRKDLKLTGHDGVNLRFSNEQIEKIKDNKPDDYKVLTAKAGTLVFADTSAIHTGMSLSEGGERYSLFNYYYPSYEDIKARKEVFRNAHKTK